MKACYPQLYLNNDPRRHTLIINDLKGNTGGTQPGAPLRSKHLGTHNHQHFLNFHNCRKKTPPSWDESKGKLITDAYSYFKVNPRWGYGMGRSGAGRDWGAGGRCLLYSLTLAAAVHLPQPHLQIDTNFLPFIITRHPITPPLCLKSVYLLRHTFTWVWHTFCFLPFLRH